MPRRIDSLGSKRRMIGISQRVITMKSSRASKDLSIMSNSAHRPSRRREIQRIPVPSMQDLPSLMAFLEK